MVAGASDSTDSDRAYAGAVYIVARRAGLPIASDVLSGALKVDAVWESYMLNGWQAMYQTAAETAKGDTLYLPWTLDASTLAGQGTILHELSHAADDKAATAPRDESARDVELKAYRAEAKLYLAQLLAIPDAAKRREEAEKTGESFAPPQIWGLILEARAWPPDEDQDPFEVVHALNGAHYPVPPAQVDRALRRDSDAENLRKALAAIDTAYKLQRGQTKHRDGLRGESSLD
jgi:hypothetical protein